MTIKELCNKQNDCSKCPFVRICPYDDYFDRPLCFVSDDYDVAITKSIIETAKMLVSEGETNYNG